MIVVRFNYPNASWFRPFRTYLNRDSKGDCFVVHVTNKDIKHYGVSEYPHVHTDDYKKFGETIILHAMTAAAEELGQI